MLFTKKRKPFPSFVFNTQDETGFHFLKMAFKQREISPLLSIHNAYPKMLIARTHHDSYQYEEIKIVDFADWLNN